MPEVGLNHSTLEREKARGTDLLHRMQWFDHNNNNNNNNNNNSHSNSRDNSRDNS